MVTFNPNCSCGWSVKVDTKADADRLDQIHQKLHRDNPAGDFRDVPQPTYEVP